MARLIRRKEELVGLLEHRKQIRHELGARAVFSWQGPDQGRLEREGVTRDISEAGAFIVTSSCPPARASVRVELFLPPLHGTVATVRLRAEMRVVRIEQAPPGDQQSGFAVEGPGFSISPGINLDDESESSLPQRLKN
jgi:PilZ domain-containing protein